LHEAVRAKATLSIKYLLDKGADKYLQTNKRENCIHLVNSYIRQFENMLELLRKHMFLQSYSWKVAKSIMAAEV